MNGRKMYGSCLTITFLKKKCIHTDAVRIMMRTRSSEISNNAAQKSSLSLNSCNIGSNMCSMRRLLFHVIRFIDFILTEGGRQDLEKHLISYFYTR